MNAMQEAEQISNTTIPGYKERKITAIECQRAICFNNSNYYSHTRVSYHHYQGLH